MRISKLIIGTVVVLSVAGCKDDAGKASKGRRTEESKLPENQGSETKAE